MYGISVKFGEVFPEMGVIIPSQAQPQFWKMNFVSQNWSWEGVETRWQTPSLKRKGDGIVQTTNPPKFLLCKNFGGVAKAIVVEHNLQTQVQVLIPQQNNKNPVNINSQDFCYEQFI